MVKQFKQIENISFILTACFGSCSGEREAWQGPTQHESAGQQNQFCQS